MRDRRILGLIALACLGTTQCSPTASPAGAAVPLADMHENFQLAVELRGHALLGDVGGARETAQRLSEVTRRASVGPPTAAWENNMEALRRAAAEGARIDSREGAAEVAASVAAECGACHQAEDVDLGDRFVVGGPPPGGSAGRHMARLTWVSRLLWDGLVGPSDRMWDAGVEALLQTGSFPAELNEMPGVRGTDEAWALLKRLGEDAGEADGAEARTRSLAEIWATCSGCHANIRP